MKQRLIIIGLIIVILLSFWKGCQFKRDRDNLLNQVSQYQIAEKSFKVKILKDSSTIATQSQTILTIDEALRLGILKLDGEIKKAQSQVRYVQKIKIDSVLVPYSNVDTSIWTLKKTDNCEEKYDSLLANSVIVPRDFSAEKKWFSINGKIKKDGVLVDSLKLENESSVTIGYKRSGFLWLKKEPIVEVKNTNPYLQVTKMNNVIIKKNKRLLDSPILWLGLGVIGGIFLNKL
jgi:hypothetical protein